MSKSIEEFNNSTKPKAFGKIGRFIVQDNYAVTFRGLVGRKASATQLEVLRKNWGKVEVRNSMSKETQKKIRSFMCVWSRSIEVYNRLMKGNIVGHPRKMVFITLTIAKKQAHSDKYMKKNMLGRFMQQLKRKYGICHYFWRAEAQKNGNLHFHILTDSYIHKSAVNYEWDLIQYDYNYLDERPVYSINYGSPSTKIEAPRADGNVAIYCVKYCLKEDGYRRIDGRMWGCSSSLKDLEAFEMPMTSELLSVILSLLKSPIIDGEASVFYDIYFGNVYFNMWLKSKEFQYESDSFHYNAYLMLYDDLSHHVLPELSEFNV